MSLNIRKIVLVCGFMLFLSEIVTARPNTKVCRKKHGKFPKEGTYCKVYYDCKNYVPNEVTCPDGENFNANKERCDWEELYPCLERPKDKECLRANGLFLKPGTDCKKYYRCCNGKAKVENCPGDTLFDPSKGNCEWSDLYTCIESLSTTKKVTSTETFLETSTPPEDQKEKSSTDPAISKTLQTTTEIPTTEVTKEKSTPRPTSEVPTTIEPKEISTTEIPTTLKPREISTTEISTTFEPKEISTPQPTTKIPTTSEPKEISTPQPTTEISSTVEPKDISSYSTDHTIFKENKEGEITDPTVSETTMEVTFSPSTVEVTTSVEDLLRNFMCPEPTGHFPHPTDKHKFVACVNNNPYIMDCPNKLVYKHRLRRCDYE